MGVRCIILNTLLISGCACLNFFIPEDLQNSAIFDVEEVHVDYVFAVRKFGVTYYDTFIESKLEEPITRVFYYGYEIFADLNPPSPRTKRMVCYSKLDRRAVIYILNKTSNTYKEKVVYIANGNLYNMLNIRRLLNGNLYRILEMTPGEFVARTFFRIPQTEMPPPRFPGSEGAAAGDPSEPYATESDVILDINNIMERGILGIPGVYSNPDYLP